MFRRPILLALSCLLVGGALPAAAGEWGTLTLPGVSPDLAVRIDGETVPVEMVVLWEGTDAVDRLALFPDADEEVSCRALLEEPRPKIEIAACGAVCLRGARFGETPAKKAIVTDFGVVDDRLEAPSVVTVAVTSRDAGREEAKGRLRVEGPGYALSGPFSALYCPSRLKRREQAAPIHGLAWGRDPIPPADLPAAALAGSVAGGRFTLAKAALVPIPHERGWFLVLHGSDPATGCAGGETVYEDDAPDALRVRLAADDVRSGGSWSARSHHDGETVRGDPVVLVWRDPGRGPVVTSVDWNVTVALDEVADGAARGRLYAAFEDTGKSFLVGGFEAEVCPDERR